MIVDCILKTWFKPKGKPASFFHQVPSYSISHYNTPDNDVKWELQIVAFDEDGDPSTVLARKEFIPDGKSIHHIHFHNVNYCYNEQLDTIYTTQTKRNI